MKNLVIILIVFLASCSSPGHKKLHTLSSAGECKGAIVLANKEFKGKYRFIHLGEIAKECEKDNDKVIEYYVKAGSPSSKSKELMWAYINTNQCTAAEKLANKKFEGNYELLWLAEVAESCRKDRKKAVAYLTVAARNEYLPAIKELINFGVQPPEPTVKPTVTTNVYNQRTPTNSGNMQKDLSNICVQDGGTNMCYDRQSQRYGQDNNVISSGGGLSSMGGLSGMSGLD